MLVTRVHIVLKQFRKKDDVDGWIFSYVAMFIVSFIFIYKNTKVFFKNDNQTHILGVLYFSLLSPLFFVFLIWYIFFAKRVRK